MPKIKKAIDFLSFSTDELSENLDENEKKDLYSWCSVVFSNPLFEKLFTELYTQQVLDTIGELENHDRAVEGRGKIFGIAGVKDIFQKYHSLYLDSIKKDEPFDKNATI